MRAPLADRLFQEVTGALISLAPEEIDALCDARFIPPCSYRAASLAAKVGPQPGVIAFEHGFDRAGRDQAAVPYCDYTVANCIQAVEIMRNHEYSKPERLAQSDDQFVEFAGANRVEA